MSKLKGRSVSQRHGFTVVELAVIIAVIGILAAFGLVAYGNYQQKIRDDVRRNDLHQVAAALKSSANWKNTYIESGSGCGVSGNGNGWLSAGPSDLGTLYPKSITKCLQEADLLEEGDFIDPSGCVWDSGGACGSWNGDPARAYMKATCKKGGAKKTYVFAYLETMPRNNAEIDALCDPGTVEGFTSTGQRWGTYYGMNYYVSI